MTPFVEALDHLLANLPQTEIVDRPLAEAIGAILANPLTASTSRPAEAMSAMDGYAVRLADVGQAGSVLQVIGDAPAGTPFNGNIQPEQAVRVFTGSVIPDGADHVIMQEDVTRTGSAIKIHIASPEPRHIRQAGIDFHEGDTLIAANTQLGAVHLAIAAAANFATLPVFRKPRVGILANGDELKAPGSSLQAGEIVNSNPAGLAPLIEKWGGIPVDLGVAADRQADIEPRLLSQDIDIFLPIGGASVGDHDHMRAAFLARGFSFVFEKVAVRPGKPCWFAKSDQQLALGLPGNPASAFVCAHLFLKPLLLRGRQKPLTAQLGEGLRDNGPRDAFLRASLQPNSQGVLTALAARNQDSSLIRPFLEAQALVHRPAHAPEAKAGDRVACYLLDGLGL